MATLGTDDARGPLASEISELRRTAKWLKPPGEIKEEDDLLTGEELKLFQSVAARVTLPAIDRPDLFYSVRGLMRKMASSSGESELAAVVRAATGELGLRSNLSDFNLCCHVAIKPDATAAVGMFHWKKFSTFGCWIFVG